LKPLAFLNHHKKLKTFFLGDVNPLFLKWVRRLLIGFWILVVIIEVPDFIGKYDRIMATLPAGHIRNSALYDLIMQTSFFVIAFPAALLLILGYGINSQSTFLSGQFGTPFQNTVFRLRQRKKK